MKESQFDDIRPYNAEEFPEAMQRIANSSSFPILASFVYPGEPLEATARATGCPIEMVSRVALYLPAQ